MTNKPNIICLTLANLSSMTLCQNEFLKISKLQEAFWVTQILSKYIKPNVTICGFALLGKRFCKTQNILHQKAV